MARRLTAAPPRYTEAGLVGRLEALGIGRPSTWAVIVGVLRERGYAAIEDGCFAPLERGRVPERLKLACFDSMADADGGR